MKIAHVISYFQPMLGYQEYYLAKEQQRMGHEVHILTSDRYYPLEGIWPKLGKRVKGYGNFNEFGLRVHRLQCVFEAGTYCLVRGLRRELEAIKPDVVHAHEIYTLTPSLPALYKRKMRYRYIVDTHSFMPRTHYIDKIIYQTLKRGIFRSAFAQADVVVAIADNCRKWFLDEFPYIPPRQVIVIPLGADHREFRPNRVMRRDVRIDLMIQQDEKLLIYAGKITPSKDLHVLLQACRILLTWGTIVKVLLIGIGSREYTHRLVNMTHRWGLGKHVIFHDPVSNSELSKFFNAADVGVWPGSRSIAIIEAMASGLPVVVPENDPSEEYPYAHNAKYYLKYHNGLSFTRGDSKELAFHLKQLVSDEKMRRKMSCRSRRLVKEEMNWNLIAKSFIDAYQRKG